MLFLIFIIVTAFHNTGCNMKLKFLKKEKKKPKTNKATPNTVLQSSFISWDCITLFKSKNIYQFI